MYTVRRETCSTISGLYITLVPLYVTQSGEKHAQLYLVYILHWFPYMGHSQERNMLNYIWFIYYSG